MSGLQLITKAPLSCDTFVVLSDSTKGKCIIFGKNSDRRQGEVQEVVYEPAKDHAAGSKLECTYINIDQIERTHAVILSKPVWMWGINFYISFEIFFFFTLDLLTIPGTTFWYIATICVTTVFCCTYIKIDQIERTHAVILSKPAWMWGAEMGSNEFGVCIGNEAVWTNVELDSTEKLIGMDLLRLGLERSKSASEAIDVITNLLETHGQGGPCSDTDPEFTYHNSFLIVDPKEAWVLETAGSFWAAEKITSGYRNISNCLSIGTKIDRMSEGLQKKAAEKGLWDCSGEFDFKKVFESDSSDCDREVAGQKLLESLTKGGNFSLTNMFDVLRNEESGICRGLDDGFPTQGSMVSVLSSSGRPHCHWFTGTPDPSQSVFKPFIFTPNAKISPYIMSPSIENDPAKQTPRFSRVVDRSHLLYRRHAKALEAGSSELRKTMKEVEALCVTETETFLDEFADHSLQEVDDLFKDCVDSELKFYA